MRLSDYLYLAKKDLTNYRLRSSLIILCICVGILSSTLNLYHTSKRAEELISSLENLGGQMISIWVQDKEIQLEDLFFLSSYFPYTSYEVSYWQDIRSFRKTKISVSIIATVPEYQQVHSVKIKEGRFISLGDINQRRKVCVVNTPVASGLKIGVGKKIRIGEDELRVIGLSKEEGMSKRVIIPLSISNEIFESDSRNLEVVILTSGNPKAVKKEIERMLKKRFSDKKGRTRQGFLFESEGFTVSIAEGLLETIKNQRLTSKMIVLGIWVVTLILAGGGIINLIMLSVRQRYKEIGVMRAYGAKKEEIFYLFLLEGILLSVYGLLLAGAIGASYVGLFGGCKFLIFLRELLWSSIICIGIGICGCFPARLAAGISPSEAIRDAN
ncbi:MAG: ABC transporter permease [bacterium]|nr:ABC transporter permease [bacterium]